MKINCKIFTFNPLGVNCSIIWDGETHDAAIVDCSARTEREFAQIEEFVETEKLQLRMALQTHTHFDHVYGLPKLYEKYGLRPSYHSTEEPIYDYAALMASSINLPIQGALPSPAAYLTDGQELKVGDILIRVVFTPGHTPGGLCFYLPENHQLFSGDTFFYGSMGRTDLPGGNQDDLIRSIRERLFSLPEETSVVPGHGGLTEIGWERLHNPFV